MYIEGHADSVIHSISKVYMVGTFPYPPYKQSLDPLLSALWSINYFLTLQQELWISKYFAEIVGYQFRYHLSVFIFYTNYKDLPHRQEKCPWAAALTKQMLNDYLALYQWTKAINFTLLIYHNYVRHKYISITLIKRLAAKRMCNLHPFLIQLEAWSAMQTGIT